MKQIGKIISFEMSLCLKTTYFIAPFILLLVFLYNLYYVCPVEVISNFCITGIVAFLIMCWLGYSYRNHQNEVTTQVVMLRVNNDLIYYVSELLFLLFISLFVSFISVGFPLAQNAIHHFGLYNRPVTVQDVISAFLLITASGFLGGCIGDLFTSGLVKDRKMELCMIIMIAALSIGKNGMIQIMPVSRYILWILPPISDISVIYSMQNQYTWTSVLFGFVVLSGYGMLAFLIATLIRRKKFN